MVKISFTQKKSIFFIPKELEIQAFYHISFVDNSGPVRVLVFDFQDFFVVWPCFGCSKLFVAYIVQESVTRIEQFTCHQDGHRSVVN